MIKKISWWLLTSLIPGCIPIFFRLLAVGLVTDQVNINPLDPIDFITLTIALNIQTFHEVSKPNISISESWRYAFAIFDVGISVVLGFFYLLYLIKDVPHASLLFAYQDIFNLLIITAIAGVMLNFFTIIYLRSTP